MSEKHHRKCFDEFGMFWLIKIILGVLQNYSRKVCWRSRVPHFIVKRRRPWRVGNAQPSLAGHMGLCGYISAASLAPGAPQPMKEAALGFLEGRLGLVGAS
jgi:hypothetical protein